jgi:hypothetical protein
MPPHKAKRPGFSDRGDSICNLEGGYNQQLSKLTMPPEPIKGKGNREIQNHKAGQAL